MIESTEWELARASAICAGDFICKRWKSEKTPTEVFQRVIQVEDRGNFLAFHMAEGDVETGGKSGKWFVRPGEVAS